jgi:hypothetical protein
MRVYLYAETLTLKTMEKGLALLVMCNKQHVGEKVLRRISRASKLLEILRHALRLYS